MKFRILGDSIITSNSAYKGLYREEPIYIEDDELYPFGIGMLLRLVMEGIFRILKKQKTCRDVCKKGNIL